MANPRYTYKKIEMHTIHRVALDPAEQIMRQIEALEDEGWEYVQCLDWQTHETNLRATVLLRRPRWEDER